MQERPTRYLEGARRSVRVARRERVDERGALDQFCRHVETIPVDGSQPEQTTDPARVAVSRVGEGLQAIRQVYERTVMAVPHYREEYDEPFFEHLSSELGDGLATNLRRATTLSPALKADLLDAAQVARERRVVAVSALDAELATLDCADCVVEDMLDALATASPASDSQLARLQARCDDRVAARRATLCHPDQGLATSTRHKANGRPALETVYADLAVRDPVVATFATVGQLVAERRAEEESHRA